MDMPQHPPQLTGQPAELHMTLQITRKATGLTETVELVGRTTVEQSQAAGIPQQLTPEA